MSFGTSPSRIFLWSIHLIYSILDHPLHSQRHSIVKDIKEETSDDLSHGTSTNTTTTPIHNQYSSNKYVKTHSLEVLFSLENF